MDLMEEIQTITPEELEKKLEAGEKLELVDVREDEEVVFGMVPGAKHISLSVAQVDAVGTFATICRVRAIRSAIWLAACSHGQEKLNTQNNRFQHGIGFFFWINVRHQV
jgi:rhodanese-related sulfurtransferase